MPRGHRPPGALACLLSLLSLLLAGCLSPDPAPEPRWFRPALQPVEVVSTSPRVNLHLRSVEAVSRLTERMAWNSGLEHGYREGLRWTDRPSAYLEEALDRALFLSGRFRRSAERGTATLEVTLLAFDERLGSRPSAVVEIHAILADADGRVRLERQLATTWEAPSGGGGDGDDDAPAVADPEALAAGLGQALSSLAVQLADELAAVAAP